MIKPLETKKIRQKKEKRNKTIFAIVIAVIMILSVVGFTIEFAQRQNIEREGGFYTYKINLWGYEIILRTIYLKNETQEVKTNFIPSTEYFAGAKFYYYIDPSLRESAIRLLQYINYFSLLNEACVNESVGAYECHNEELPIKDCESNFLIFEQANETSIEKRDLCIFIKGNKTEIDKAIDRFLFDLFGL